MKRPCCRRRRRDDSGSMPLAMLLTMVMLSAGALIGPIVLNEFSTTRQDQRRQGALHEARSGLEAATAGIRAAADQLGAGVLAELPCGPLSGGAATAGVRRYSVTIDYYPSDPAGRSSSWLSSNRIGCPATTIPAFARLTSRGHESGVTRTLIGTYSFRTTNANVDGGAIRANTGNGAKLCVDAGSGAPANGASITLQTCVAAKQSQMFSYNSDLTISLISTMTTARPFGMCIDGGATLTVGDPITMQPCAQPLPVRQQWSYAESGRFAGTTDGRTLNAFCLNVQTPDTAGSPVVLGGTSAGSCDADGQGLFDTRQTFFPESTTGAGAAGAENGQLMNFGQFSRCIDVTFRDVNMPYLMSWPCKQAPDPAEVFWNQKWVTPPVAAGATQATGTITTSTTYGARYCMQSPNSIEANKYVRLQPCASDIATAEFQWTVVRDTGDYTTSYRIIDGYGNCLAAADQNAVPSDFVSRGDRVTKMVVRTCSASALQKWNAPAYLSPPAPLRNIGER